MNSPQPPILFRFGKFELDLRARELRKEGRSTGLPDQSITVLAMLLKRPGELVLRDYQLRAIDQWFAHDCRGLLEMATGTGKTYTTFQIIWRLWKAGHAKRAQ